MVKVRFAPSPTGYLHIGGARTALFNWMYARAQSGKFVLRIEDTDTHRSRKEYVDEILESMKWLGLDWDELYFQSERFDIYRQYAQQLLSEGVAYKDGDAIILKIPDTDVTVYDIIRGEITFDSSLIKDQVLIKSDGSPAYSFACVLDDHLMGITHVIRGEDHISNTPKQVLICQVLGIKPPKYAHLPLILGKDGERLSKRNGAVAVSEYKAMGFLPEALVNYLMLLGWSPGNNQEIMSLSFAIKRFSIKKINKAAAIFSMEKLKWINSQYIKKMESIRLAELLKPILKEKGYISDDFDIKILEKMAELYKRRLPTLMDFLERADFLFLDKISIEKEAAEKYLTQDKSKEFALLAKKLDNLSIFDEKTTEKAFREVVAELGISSSELVHPVRVVLTGRAVGPGLFETMAVLGKEKTICRLKQYIHHD